MLFVKVMGDEAQALAQACNADRFPLFQLYAGAAGHVATFTASMSAEGLARLRLALRHHSSPRSAVAPGQRGPASVLVAPGWPTAV